MHHQFKDTTDQRSRSYPVPQYFDRTDTKLMKSDTDGGKGHLKKIEVILLSLRNTLKFPVDR